MNRARAEAILVCFYPGNEPANPDLWYEALAYLLSLGAPA